MLRNFADNILENCAPVALYAVDVAVAIAKAVVSLLAIAIGVSASYVLVAFGLWCASSIPVPLALLAILVEMVVSILLWWFIISFLQKVYATPR